MKEKKRREIRVGVGKISEEHDRVIIVHSFEKYIYTVGVRGVGFLVDGPEENKSNG